MHKLGVRKVTSVGTIVQLYNASPHSKQKLQQVDRLLRIYVTVPMASATAERSFSALRRLKNYLRTTMTQKQLNHLIVMHIHKERTDQLDLSSIATRSSYLLMNVVRAILALGLILDKEAVNCP